MHDIWSKVHEANQLLVTVLLQSSQRVRAKRTVYPKLAYIIVLEYLKNIKRIVSPLEIAHAIGINYNTVRGSLQRLKRKGLVEYTDKGWRYVKG